MKIFSFEGGLMRSISKFTDCICLSIMFLLCCIPVITIGTALSSLYYAIYKVVRHDRGYIFQEYVSAFRDNFKQTVPVWLLALAVIVAAVTAVLRRRKRGFTVSGQKTADDNSPKN